jgi:NMD protein affecting ribosome stability and mRNA decay
MNKMICPRCGMNVDKLYENLCLSCYLERLEVQEIFVRKCKICGKYFVSKKSFESINEALEFYKKKFLSKKWGELIAVLPPEKIKIIEKEFVCKKCEKKVTKKVEAIVQLRGEDVEEIVKEFEVLGTNVKEGIDLNFSSKKDAYEFVNKLRKKYKLLIKISKKLVGMKGGKRVYKDTIVVRIDGKRK